MSAILQAQGVGVRLGGVPIVNGADLSLRTGELTAMVGPNGAGKTTLIRALAGLLPFEGRIAINGRALKSRRARGR